MSHSITRTFLVLATAISLTHLPAAAQNITGNDVKETFVKEWERAKAYTLDYLNTMPADKYSFKAVDSIRSFAQQMLHLASGNVGLMQRASGATIEGWPGRDYNLESHSSAQTKDSVVYYVTKSYDFCIQSVKNFDVSKFGEEVTVFGTTKATRFALFLKTFEHQTHHRGQTTIYIRLQGIRPPNERLF
jgi:uncharacterized damage-inducible protein DinB